jgi:hypothetical protein
MKRALKIAGIIGGTVAAFIIIPEMVVLGCKAADKLFQGRAD